MFESDLLDFFSRVPAWVVPVLWLPIIAASAAYSVVGGSVAFATATGLFFVGWFVWSLMEYWLHRTVFHWVPNFWWGERFHFYLHGVHHKWFQDKYRLVMPPAASIAVAVVVIGSLRVLAVPLEMFAQVSSGWIYAMFAGIAWGYVLYDMTHYYIHHFKPTTKMMKALRAHHNMHHHNDAYKEKKFGVSMTLWDHVFRTY